jgi:replicative DNA helicase
MSNYDRDEGKPSVMIGKVPPHSIDAEMSLLGTMILDKEAIMDASERVTGDDFFLEKHRLIFDSVISLYSKDHPVDMVTLTESLKGIGVLDTVGGYDYITELTDKGYAITNAAYYAKIIEEKSLIRKLIAASTQIIEKGFSTPEANEVLELAEKSIFDISQKKNRGGMVDIKEILTETINRIEELHKDKSLLTGVSTGFSALDKMTNGLQRSDLILVAARPAMGKTAFSLNICQFAGLKGNSVAIFSLEMSKEQLVQRMISSHANIPSQRLRTGDLGDDEWLLLAKSSSMLGNASIYIDDTPAITPLEMRAKCRKLKMEKGLDMIMVDYLQLMSSSGKGESRQQEISSISRALKGLAREMNCPVIALSQLSRAPELRMDHRPILSDLRESGAIEQDADIVMFLYRDEYYFPEETAKPGIGEVIIAKQRNGQTGKAELAWIGEYTKYGNLSTDLEDYYKV